MNLSVLNAQGKNFQFSYIHFKILDIGFLVWDNFRFNLERGSFLCLTKQTQLVDLAVK